ncbi:hypothetical protein pb186bvf_015192 [Paramecium bursaria]
MDVNSAFPRRMFRYSFIRLGNQYNYIEVFVNRKLMGVQDVFYKPLPDEQAIQKGADFFSELFIYTCLLGIPLYEIYRSTRDANKKSQLLQDRLQNIENKIQEAKTIHKRMTTNLDDIVVMNKALSDQLSNIQNQVGFKLENAINKNLRDIQNIQTKLVDQRNDIDELGKL